MKLFLLKVLKILKQMCDVVIYVLPYTLNNIWQQV